MGDLLPHSLACYVFYHFIKMADKVKGHNAIENGDRTNEQESKKTTNAPARGNVLLLAGGNLVCGAERGKQNQNKRASGEEQIEKKDDRPKIHIFLPFLR